MVLPWQRVAEFLLESVFPEQIISQLVQLGNWSQEGSWDGEECGEGTGPSVPLHGTPLHFQRYQRRSPAQGSGAALGAL